MSSQVVEWEEETGTPLTLWNVAKRWLMLLLVCLVASVIVIEALRWATAR